jgi:tripartite-type tricarboxylate transporter receptor subunit TctC
LKRFLAAFALLLPLIAAAQEPYPAKPIRFILPFPPGGGTDLLGRLIAERLGASLGQPVVTENRGGAGGNVGAEAAVHSAPDGYTIVLVAPSLAISPTLYAKLNYDPVKDFAPIALLATGALGVYINPKVPAKNMREFIAVVKKEPGKLYYSSPGSGGPQHLAMELLKLETGMDIVHVPYKGAAGAIADLVGGHVQAMVSALQTVAPHVQSGRLRMLAVMSAKRAEAFPDVPTLKEAGAPDLEVETWYAMFAPAGTSSAIVARINRDVNELLKEADVRDVLAKQGLDPAGGAPEILGDRVKRELANWTRVVKAAGIKAD